MARKKPPMQYVPLEERPEFIAALDALPTDTAELVVRASRVRQLYHDAMLANDLQALDDADLVYRACVIKLNNGTASGSAVVMDELAAKFAAPPGQVPEWGQAGEFLLEVEGMRVVVKMCVDGLANHCGAELLALDFDRPFISRTGYRHQYMRPALHVGRTVDQAVRVEVLEVLASEGKAVAIDQEHGASKDRKVWPWLAEALAGERPDGQLAMFGDAPKQPAAKAPKSNAQRQKALRERRKAQQLKSVMMTQAECQWLEQLRHLCGGLPMQDGNEFSKLEVTDVHLVSVWESLPTDFSRAATALGLLRLRNNQHAELARAVEVLQTRLRGADLNDQVSTDKKPWYWNESPLGDYRATSAPEYMERLGAISTLADDLREARRYLASAEEQIARLHKEQMQSFENNRLLRARLKSAGLSDDF